MTGMAHLMDKTGQVLRLQETKDANNVVTGKAWQPIDEPHPCKLSARSLSATPTDQAVLLTNVYTLVFDDPAVDVQAGDLVEIDGIHYRCAEPHRPRNHHVQITVTCEGEA